MRTSQSSSTSTDTDKVVFDYCFFSKDVVSYVSGKVPIEKATESICKWHMLRLDYEKQKPNLS